MDITKSKEQKGEGLKKSKQSPRDLWDKWTNMPFRGVSEEEKGICENIWRNNGWKLSKFDESMNILEAQQIPCMMNSKRPSVRHIIKNKYFQRQKQEKILKAAREK